MLGFKTKKGTILNHWIAFADGFYHPPQDFYVALEKAIADRKLPGLEIGRCEFGEGGMISDRRLYFRMLRERLAFDTCAAPFGNTYFFSCRAVELLVKVRLWHIVVVLLFWGLIWFPLDRLLGPVYGSYAVAGLLLALFQVMRNTWNLGLADLDALLLRIPALGPIYERWFRPETYYRTDTRLVYLELVPKLVKELAEEVAGAKGIKLVRQYQLAPILGDLYKPLPVPTKPDAV